VDSATGKIFFIVGLFAAFFILITVARNAAVNTLRRAGARDPSRAGLHRHRRSSEARAERRRVIGASWLFYVSLAVALAALVLAFYLGRLRAAIL
jgi:ABC-type phosphate transport system permease subunit